MHTHERSKVLDQGTSPPPQHMPLCGCRLSRSGLIAYASSTDCVGPIAATVADVAALLGAVAGEDRMGDSTALQQPVPDYTAILKTVRFGTPDPCKL